MASLRVRATGITDSNAINLALGAVRKAGGKVAGWQADFEEQEAVLLIELPPGLGEERFLKDAREAGLEM